ncbi:obscurin-like protein 1 isoform X7 [Conger conger]|uniref:obscurin-like protein 1 isoform X7 n=1 Tax=Conger conger TaxID=82655 RepID=UPI002A5A8A0D|nr:obscurin-like protein 1 isoform X7 [Conger conger]
MDVFGGAPRFLAYPRPVIVQSGTDAALKCQIGGDPRPAVIWERNNERIHPEARYRLFEDGNVYNLIISGVTSDDSGQYICKAKNSIGETYAAATLKVEGEAQEKELREENKPRFLIKPLSTRVGRGEDAVFSCKLWGKPLPEVVWEKDGKRLNEIFESTHFSVGYQDGGWFQLKIFKTRAPDGGVYTCKAKNEFGEGLAGAVLLVDAGPGHEEEATRNGYANGHWKAQQGKARGGRQVVSRQREEPLPHSAKVKMFAVTEGKHAKFRCYVTGKPKPEIIWRKDGRVILSGRRYLLYEDREGYFTLKVLYCKQQDNGVYVCAASNTAGQTLSAVHLTVKEPLVRFKQPLSDLEVFERELAVLECEVPEDSIPITWYLEDRRLHPGSKYGMEEWGTKRRLTIRDIGADDDGIYLCEMADGGRSIAEVAVKGTIVRKLPRKVDVLEGENAAFCVEVEEEEMEIHWYKDGVELRETHQTIIKSFGKTHILVFVNASPQDSGKVTFIVGRSKTSSQLRVKAVRHSSPSCPVGVQINTERANAALLSWLPAQDSRRNPPSGYVLERKEEGSHEWLQCLTTDSATAVEILGDSVPCEADYRFRICSVNKYGRSSHVEFPRPAHLVPGAKIQTPLQDALVPEGQDATFTIELSAAVIGTWFLNGVQLQDDERFAMRRSRTHHSLRIRAVRDTDNGVEITFIACGVRDSAALYIQAPLVKFTPLSEMDRNKFVEVGNPIVLYCELSDPATPVHWYKNGVELHTVEGLNIQSEGNMRRIVIQSAEFSHSGVYSCDAIDDVIRFNVEVEAPPVRFSALPEVAKSKSVEAGGPILLHCEISDPSAQVSWYKDGLQLLPQSGVEIQSEGTARTLAVPSADILHTGVYSCKTKGDAIKFNVDIKAQPVKFSATPEVERNKSIDAGCPIVLHCEISDPTAQVSWHKDGVELRPQSGIEIQSKATIRRLVVQSAQLCHSGVYRCETSDDAVQFTVDIKAPPVKFCSIPEDERSKSVEAGHPIVLNCQLSDPSAQVSWFKDGSELFPKPGIDIRSAGIRRTLVVEFARLSDSGAYCCSTADDTVQFNVKVKAPPVRFLNLPEEERNRCVEAGCPIILHCEISDPTGQVSWYKDEKQILSQTGIQIQSEGKTRTLTIQSAEVSHAGVYSCKTTSDVIQFNVDIRAEVFHSRLYSCEISDDTVQTIMDVKAHPEDEKSNFVETDWPSVQHCELSDPTAEIKWSKDGQNLLLQNGIDIQSEGTTRGLSVQSAKLSHTGSNSCETMEDARQFHMDVKAPPVRLSALPEVEENRPAVEADRPSVQHCEISEPPAQVTAQVYQDGLQLLPQASADIQSDGSISGTIAVRSTELSPSGVYSRETKDDGVQVNLGFEAPSTHFKESPEEERNRCVEAGCPIILHCEISDPTAQVSWHKDGVQLYLQSGVDIQSEGHLRKLVVQSAERSHSGVYSCSFADEVITFKVDVQDLPVRFSEIPEVAKSKSVEAGCPIVLQCEISESTGQVSWYKDGVQLHPKSGVEIQSEEKMRTLTIQSAELIHAGTYRCETADDTISFKVDVKAPPVRFSTIQEVQKSKSVEAGRPIVLHCEISDSTAPVSWFKDGLQLLPQSGVVVQSEGSKRTLILQSSGFSTSGVYSCKTADDIIEFYVDIKAPPVTFLEMAEENLHKSIVELDPLVLNCQVSRPEATVLWYKDGAEMQPSHNVTIQAEGTMRRLILRSSQLSDAGTYTCRAGDNALIFKVNIREPPVMIIYPKEDVHLDRHVSEEVVLSCELSRSNGMVYWYKDGQKLQESQSIKLKSEGPYRRLKILNCGIEDSGEYVCDTAGDSIFFQLNITEPPVCIVSPSQSQMELCQQTSERMVLSCEISRSNATVRWYRDGLQVEESQNLLLEVDGVYRRLIIPETTVQDSAEYVCDTGDDSVTFFVNIAEPPVRFVRPRKMPSAVEVVVGNPLVLECEVSRPNAEVSWKKDGDEMEESRSVTIIEDGIFRQLTVHVSKLQHSGQYICDAKDDVMDFNVKVTEAPVKIVKKGELKTEQQHWESDDIVLECELSSADGVVQWSKDGQSVAENEHFCFEEEGAFRSLVILNAELSDTGEYACNSKDDNIVFHINVKERPVSIVGNSESRENHSLLTGDDLILACEVSRSNAPVEWYCNGTLLSPDARTHIDSYGTVRKLVLTGLRPSDSGEYICDAVDDKMIILVKVQEPPVKFLDKERANLVTGFENESVTLSATTSRDTATVRWLKDWTQISGERFHVRQEGNRHFLTIDPLHRSDGGGYTCDTTGDEMHFNLLVKEMRVRFSRPLEDAVAHKDGMVTLRCELCRTKGDVLWMKDGAEITPSRRFAIRADGPERSLTIHRLTPEDGGEYTCESKDDRTSATLRVEMPRIVEFIAELQNTTVMEGEDANFKCVVSPEDVELLWQMDNERIYPSEKFMMSSNGLCRMLHIRNCKVSDRSKITAEAEGVLSKAKLQVQEAQVLFTKKMDAVEAEEFGEATLEVEVTPEAGEVHWMRQNVVIQPGPKFTLKQNGPKRILTVHNLSLSDRGMYRCETLHDRTQGKINVEPRRISVRRGLNAIETFERETASFEVELSHGNVEGAWQKDGIRLKPSNRWRVSTKDRVHGLTLSNLTLEDTGTITFSAEGVKSSARLTVREPPVTILKKLEDHCFPEGSAVSLECELSRQNVDVKWLKNGMEMKQSKNQRIYSMGRKRFFQITKCEIRDSGVYTCDAGDVNTCCSLEVYEQEVEIVQGLEDLEIQEDQNAVFMCEVSLPDVPGEWYRNGEKIRPTGIVKIRQEGNKHFLLMCNVRVEDAGEIQFVAKQVESTASLVVEELPVSIVKPLRDKTALEGHRVVLECTVSNPRCSIRWYQGSKVILPAERFEICSEGCNRKLVIQPLEREDEGMYSVQAGEHTTSARLSVEAQLLQIVRELKDVTVAAPEEAAFECEVTVASSKAPVWSLNEETLRPGPQVRMESRDTVHRLILKNTSADMSGTVRFSSGKAKSSARLTVTD